MPYSCKVVRTSGSRIVLEVEPEQPDAEPFYTRADFALGLLTGEGPSALATALGDDAVEALATESIDPTPFIRSVSTTITRRGSLRDDTAPLAHYDIEVVDPKWIAHLPQGAVFESYAWSESGGPFLGNDDVWEPLVLLPAESFTIGDRVSVHQDLPIGPGVLRGRGRVVASATRSEVPASWKGGCAVHRIVFDHGPVAWAFAESMRRPPSDTYERAWADPGAFFASVLAESPLERARSLHFMGLRGGGASAFPPDATRAFKVAIEGHSSWMHCLLRRLPLELALEIATELLDGWLDDVSARSKKFGRDTPGVELARGDTIKGYQFECYAPTAFVLGALTLLFAQGPRRAPASPAGPLRRTLSAVPSDLFGYGGWTDLAAYPLAACDDVPPALPDWLLVGHDQDTASEPGLEGRWVHPIDADLYRP